MEFSHMDQTLTYDPEVESQSFPFQQSIMKTEDEKTQEWYNLKRKNDLLQGLLAEMPTDVKSFLVDPDTALEQLQRARLIVGEEEWTSKIESTSMDLTLVPGSSESLSHDHEKMEMTVYYEEKYDKQMSDRILPLEKNLSALQNEMATFKEIEKKELEELMEKLKQQHLETSVHQDTSETYEIVQSYKEKIDELKKSIEQEKKESEAAIQLAVEKQQELEMLSGKASAAREYGSSLKKQIKDIEEEVGVLQNRIATECSRSLSDRPHMLRGNSMFAEIDDRRKLLQDKIRKLRVVYADELNTRDRLKLKLLMKKSQYDNMMKNLNLEDEVKVEDTPCKVYERVVGAANKMEKLVPCSLPCFEPDTADSSIARCKDSITKMDQEAREELEETRANILKIYTERMAMVEDTYKKSIKHMKMNYKSNMLDVKNKYLTSEIERIKIVVAEKKAKQEKEKKKVRFNEASDEKHFAGKEGDVRSASEGTSRCQAPKKKGPKVYTITREITMEELDAMPCLTLNKS